MSPQHEIERCNQELDRIRTQPNRETEPAWLMAMGECDWELEKDLIAQEEYAQPALELKAPFPWFGGKSRVAPEVWDRFGKVDNYVEPFAGSLAVLLNRPDAPGTETVNDIDCYLSNFWRALSYDPFGVAGWADWPVNEADLHARHLWLVNREEFREKMKTDPEFYDVQVAGWWVWGISQWIGSGWCSRPEWTGRANAGREDRGIHALNRRISQQIPHLADAGEGVHRKPRQDPPLWRKLPHLGDAGKGVQRVWQQRPADLGESGRGINRVPHARPSLRGDSGAAGMGIFANRVVEKRPHLSGHGPGVGVHGDELYSGLYAYMYELAHRLRRVRVCCGDWKRVTGPSVTTKHGVCGIFLDPPYDMRVVSNAVSKRDGAAPTDGLYANHDNDLSAQVRQWAIENGENKLLRIALCGYEGEHNEMPATWECVHWKAHGGYGSQRGNAGYENAKRERIWFSPYCLRQPTLFD